jgi:hypothetical protein
MPELRRTPVLAIILTSYLMIDSADELLPELFPI